MEQYLAQIAALTTSFTTLMAIVWAAWEKIRAGRVAEAAADLASKKDKALAAAIVAVENVPMPGDVRDTIKA
jgi:hypothetical protein